MKARMLLAAIGLAAVICTVVVLANPETNSCLAFLWSGPPGVENLEGNVEMTFYTAHIATECDCGHSAGTIRLRWRIVDGEWSDWITMSEYSSILCQATIYEGSFHVYHQSTIDVEVNCTNHASCGLTMVGWRVP